MRILTVVLLTLPLLIAVTDFDAFKVKDEEEFREEWKSQAKTEREKKLVEMVETFKRCTSQDWSCNKACRAQVPLSDDNTTVICQKPEPGDTCFGAPIHYMYVPSREELPAEYEVLARFPRCWRMLGPLMCGMIYRPCGKFGFEAHIKSKTEKMEVWQRFGQHMCTRVEEACQDAIDEGLFPSHLVDCKRTAENPAWRAHRTNMTGPLVPFVPNVNKDDLITEWERRTLFTSESCTILYKENVTRYMQQNQHQCAFPLVYTDAEKEIPAVFDKCYLPCRNPFISSQARFLSFVTTKAVICVFFGVMCAAIFFFLFFYSGIYSNSHAIFAIAHSLLAIAIYLLFWGLGSIDGVAYKAECLDTSQGVPIRKPHDHGSTFEWCVVSGVVQHIFFLASIGFLSAAYAFSAAPVGGPLFDEEKALSKKSDFHLELRPATILLVYAVSVIFGVVGALFQMHATDGMSGVCTVGMHSLLDHLAVVALPGLVFCAIGLGLGLYDCWREGQFKKKHLEQTVEEKIALSIQHEKAKVKMEFWKVRAPPHHRDMEEDKGRLAVVEEASVEGSEKTTRGDEDERDGEEDILVLRGDEEEEECKWMSEADKKALEATIRADHEEEWRGRVQQLWNEGISSRYTLVALILCIVGLLLGLVIHGASLDGDPRMEVEAVKEYVKCVFSSSIAKKDSLWLAETVHAEEMWRNGTAENDPLKRRQRIASGITVHGCHYPSTGDGRIAGILSVFLLLPLLPLCIFLWAFWMGMAGYGGMRKVRIPRPRAIKQSEKDIEMSNLSTKRNVDSEVASTLRATSPVPSSTRSDIVMTTEDRLRTDASGVRKINVMTRQQERKAAEKARERAKKKAELATIGDRCGETGKLQQKENSEFWRTDQADARSVSSHASSQPGGGAGGSVADSTGMPSASLSAYPPNAARRAMTAQQIRLAQSSQHVQQQLMLVQEGLQRSAPNRGRVTFSGEENDEDTNLRMQRMQQLQLQHQQAAPPTPEWLISLHTLRQSFEVHLMDRSSDYDLVDLGMQLSGVTGHFGNLLYLIREEDIPVHNRIVRGAVQRMQMIIYLLDNHFIPNDNLYEDSRRFLTTLREHVQHPGHPIPADMLQRLSLEDDDEDAELLNRMDQLDITDEQRSTLRQRLLDQQTRRYVTMVNTMQLQQRVPLPDAAPAAGAARPAVYPPSMVVDLSQPPPYHEGGSDAGSSAFSQTNSSVPSSSLTTSGDGRMYTEYMQPLGAPPPPQQQPPAAPAAAGTANTSMGISPFMASVMRANGMQAPPAVGLPLARNGAAPAPNGVPFSAQDAERFQNTALYRYALQSAHFPAPTSSSQDMRNDVDGGGIMSSETSLDESLDQPGGSPLSSLRASFTVPIWEPASAQRPPTVAPGAPPAPSLFPWVQPDPSIVVPTFPGALTNRRLHATQEEQNAALKAEWDREQQRRREEDDQPFGPISNNRKRRNGDGDEGDPPSVALVRASSRQHIPELHDGNSTRRRDASAGSDASDSGVSSTESLGGRRTLAEGPLQAAPVQLDRRPEPARAVPRLVMDTEFGTRAATVEEMEEYERMIAERLEEQERREWEELPGPSGNRGNAAGANADSNGEERRRRMLLRNQYLNHSDPDLAMVEEDAARMQREEREEEERARQEREDYRAERRFLEAQRDIADQERIEEEWKRERRQRRADAAEAGAQARREAGEDQGAIDSDDSGSSASSTASKMEPNEQNDLVIALRVVVQGEAQARVVSDEHRRLVLHLRRALSESGGISREEIMRFRVNEINVDNRRRIYAQRHSPYSVSSVVVSRMSLNEIAARADVIRRQSPHVLYPLEVYYQLHLADVLWPLAGRDVRLGDNVYTHDEVNRVLGADTPLIPPGADRDDFHQLMRKRAITAASLTGRAYGEHRVTPGFNYQPPRLPDLSAARTFGDVRNVFDAINNGDYSGLLEAIDDIALTMPDVMRLDNRSQHTLGTHLRHFRDFLDAQAAVIGYPLRDDAYPVDTEAIPDEPTGPVMMEEEGVQMETTEFVEERGGGMDEEDAELRRMMENGAMNREDDFDFEAMMLENVESEDGDDDEENVEYPENGEMKKKKEGPPF